ncbi:MAG: pyridoxal-phosphate dependent enzyme [Pikeienuella sp.]|uniref:pyridoxal-phosphate dependent enzyme n=1 Tax=Pikeienuella sp. TaxID=2831957 RepID=UPI00391B73F6
MTIFANPFRGSGLPAGAPVEPGSVESDPAAARALFARCPKAAGTPLLNRPDLAARPGIGALHLKDERGRMGLGSFKALGAAHAIAKRAEARGGRLEGETIVTASAGNHGLSVAAGAAAFGAEAAIYVAETVPEAFADRLRARGARVVRYGAIYEEAMAAAAEAAAREGWFLLSDSSWPGYSAPARDVMEGYLIMAEEAAAAMPAPPTHLFLQAGVGGLAAAVAAHARRVWGAGPVIAVVEPAFAPALLESVRAGRPALAPGPVSIMGRLDCKEPSHLALAALARDADLFMTVTEAEADGAGRALGEAGLPTTPSGGAGFAGLEAAARAGAAGLGPESRALVFLSEGPEDA